jgi:tRNA G37 N-methylase Trm5
MAVQCWLSVLLLNSPLRSCNTQVAHKVHCYNADARAFLRDLAGRGVRFDHALMNLPATAIEFLGG